MIENRSAPPGPIVPTVVYQDVPKAIEWLCGAFGFTERLRTPAEPDGTIHHAQLAVGQGSVILTGQSQRPCANSCGALMVRVEDVDAHFERAKKYGSGILAAPHSTEFGERQYAAEDLAGHRWVFTQSIADVAPEEWGAKVSRILDRFELLPRPRLCYLLMHSDEASHSAAFYEKLFGWNIRNRDTDSPSFDDASAVSGAFIKEPGLLPFFWVDNIEETLARIPTLGGTIVEGVHPDHADSNSLIATFRDPGGNLIGLHQQGTL